MSLGLAHKIKLALIGLDHYNALLSGLGSNVPESFVNLTLGDENLIYISSGPQRLNNGVATFNYIILEFSLFHN